MDSNIGRTQFRKRERDTATIEAREPQQIQELVDLNRLVEQAWQIKSASPNKTQNTIQPGFLCESIWDTWLWGEDPMEEAPVNATMLNRMQLLGLLIARCVLILHLCSVSIIYPKTKVPKTKKQVQGRLPGQVHAQHPDAGRHDEGRARCLRDSQAEAGRNVWEDSSQGSDTQAAEGCCAELAVSLERAAGGGDHAAT